ncbi:MAG TPA: PEGA domain-containing protein, partial [Burkholderiales bacterium]|jgi:class 3 adenylate cyclase|nr:PEGA domain-containing protein [Burkholderiales bacterium]
LESAGRTLVCSVLFLDIADYSQKPVAEQLQLKQAFNQALAVALEHVAARDRVILDTGDGAAITFMGDPEDALFASMAMRDLSATVPVRLGVNLGPVRLVKDLNGQVNIIGDGINVAQRVMSFSRPGQLLVSRSFYEVVSCLSRDYANLFRHEGSRTDKHVRAHEVYAVVGATPAPRRVDEAEARSESVPPGAAGWLTGTGPLGLRRTALLAAPLVFLLIVAGGVGARAMLPEEPPVKATAPKPAAALPQPAVQRAPATPPPAAAAPVPAAVAAAAPAAKPPAPAAGGGAAVIEQPPKKKLVVARAEGKPAEKPQPPQPNGIAGRVELAVAPWGEVLVDGKSRGISPPLRVLELPPGSHTVEIRNSTFPAHVAKVEVKAGEAVRIQHRFR